uniref:CobW/HypB/UreG nucleotide-binding domain-containing protein n=1 Tax=Mantoniella antarctica TaxID=81844 RepID=A0A7S0SNX2_9CHLO
MDDAAPSDAEKVPVTIITGFLGAGKTTLVNHILKGDHGMIIAVIENEFGAVSIDDALVGENMKEKEDVITMDNGCVCCTVRGDLVRALLTLKDRPKKFDHIIIETTGLADPAPVAFTFFINPEIADAFRIDSILCLADAKHIALHLEEEKADGAVNEAVSQVAFADRILLNKIDLVSAEQLQDVVDTIHSINAVADVIQTTNSVVDLTRILGVSSFSIEKTLEVDPEFLDEEDSLKAVEGVSAGNETAKKKIKKKRHDLTGVSSVGILAEGELDFTAVNTFMMKLLQVIVFRVEQSVPVS